MFTGDRDKTPCRISCEHLALIQHCEQCVNRCAMCFVKSQSGLKIICVFMTKISSRPPCSCRSKDIRASIQHRSEHFLKLVGVIRDSSKRPKESNCRETFTHKPSQTIHPLAPCKPPFPLPRKPRDKIRQLKEHLHTAINRADFRSRCTLK